MKLTIFIMTLFLLNVSAATKAQITLNTKQESLLRVLDKISKQSGYDLICTVQDFKNSNPVTLKVNNVSVEQALKEAFAGQPLVYELSGTTMMVKRKEEKEASIIDRIKSYLASINIAGTVQDQDGQPLAGAGVKIKDGKGNTLTGTKGEFLLKNVPEGSVIEFTYIGYKKKSLPAQEMMGFIRMEMSDNKLDEVQVQFSGVTSRRTSISNITTIKAAEIAKQPVDNPLYALMGRVPGLIITPTSGGFNAPVKVQLRGQNSLSNVESEPLFVIDGVPFANNMGGQNGAYTKSVSALSFINSQDIESIDVLKDADATAIYGSRGGNGVILITTKKGKIGATKVDANVNVGFSAIPINRIKMMNTQQYLQMRREAYMNDGLPVPDAGIPNGDKNISNFDLTVWDPNRYTDWQKELLSNIGKNQQAILNASGGNELLRYSVGITYNKAGLPVTGKTENNFQQMGTGTFTLNGNSANRKFQVSLTGSYGTNESVTAAFDQTSLAFTLPPNAPALYKADGSLNWEPNPGSPLGEATWINPLASLLNTSTTKSDIINSSSNISYEISSKLKFNLIAGFNQTVIHRVDINTIAAQDPAFFSSNTGRTAIGDSKSSNWSVQPQFSHRTVIGRGKLDVLFGGALQKGETTDQSISAGGYTSDALLGTLAFASPGGITGSNSGSEYKYAGVFTRVGYNWDEKYILNLNARRDGSSRFGPGYQYGNFGSVGAAWIFSNESFLKDKSSILSLGKLRASYGTNGNDQIGDYQYLELFSSADGSTQYQGRPVLTSSGVVNKDYHWEQRKSLELGFELGFFKDRLLLSGSYFKSVSGDQLLRYNLPSTAGSIYGIVINQHAKIQNTGMELNLNSTNIAKEGFRWTTTLNISFANRNKLLALPQDALAYQSRLANIYDTTKPFENLIGKSFAGLIAVNEFRGIDPTTGLALFSDVQGNPTSDEGLINRYAKVIDLNPKFYGGISNQFGYKGFTLDIFFEFKKQVGKSIYNLGFVSVAGQPGNLPAELANSWHKDGDNAAFQKFSQNYSTAQLGGYMMISDVAYTDASYLRIKNIALSYDLPTKINEKLHLKNFSLFVNVQNAFTITGYRGADPETQNWFLPPLRMIQTGIRVGL